MTKTRSKRKLILTYLSSALLSVENANNEYKFVCFFNKVFIIVPFSICSGLTEDWPPLFFFNKLCGYRTSELLAS